MKDGNKETKMEECKDAELRAVGSVDVQSV